MDMENKANNELIILYLKYILYILYLLENILNNENYIIRIQALSLIWFATKRVVLCFKERVPLTFSCPLKFFTSWWFHYLLNNSW